MKLCAEIRFTFLSKKKLKEGTSVKVDYAQYFFLNIPGIVRLQFIHYVIIVALNYTQDIPMLYEEKGVENRLMVSCFADTANHFFPASNRQVLGRTKRSCL